MRTWSWTKSLQVVWQVRLITNRDGLLDQRMLERVSRHCRSVDVALIIHLFLCETITGISYLVSTSHFDLGPLSPVSTF